MKPLLERRCVYPQDNSTTLKLSSPARLPRLANHCFIVGEAKRADVIWSEGDFLALCEHMLNDNPPDYFLSAWIDKTSGRARFAKAPRRSRADKRASWAWATITGKAKSKTAIGFYPSNQEKKSRWAAIDFDAHNGEHEQARKRSLEAFSLLLQNPQLHLILCASGNGYHLFIFTRELFPIGQWIVLLKQACEWIGVPIADGICELFPNERAESQRVGKGIRAPGTLNPKTGTLSLIEAETIRPLLETLPTSWKNGVGKVICVSPRNNTALSLHKSTNYYSLSTEPLIETVLRRHPIERIATRNGVLLQLVGELFHKFGRNVSEGIVREHYCRYRDHVRTSLDEHMREFGVAWDGLARKIANALSPCERRKLDQLRSTAQLEAFFIIRAFAGAALHNGCPEFPIAQSSLADRLGITPPGAADVIRNLIDAGIINLVQPYQRHKTSARYLWAVPMTDESRWLLIQRPASMPEDPRGESSLSRQ
jgi:hypothetical protein